MKQKDFPSAKVVKLWKFKIYEIDEWVFNGGARNR
jgi:hypothetical protein